MRELSDLRARLREYRGFSECVVRNIRWRDFGTSVDVVIDFVWADDGSVRSDHAERRVVTLSFVLVQEFVMRNHLNASMVSHPAEINWGHNELALVEVHPVDDDAYGDLPVSFYRACLLWERGPWIEVVFRSLEIHEATQTPGEWSG